MIIDLFSGCTLVVHPFVLAFGGQQEHIPLIIVGYFYHTVEIEKSNPPTPVQRDGKRRIVFVNKLQPEPTTVMVYFQVGGTARAYPCPADITKRKTGMFLRCRTGLTQFSFHGRLSFAFGNVLDCQFIIATQFLRFALYFQLFGFLCRKCEVLRH